MTDSILLIAQASALITVLFGIISVIIVTRAAKNLLPGSFKSILSFSVISIIIIVVGNAAMLAYHLFEGTAFHDASETAEKIWYVFMFVGLFLSCLESVKIASFGKSLNIKPAPKKKRTK